jgi:hypothetical protein
MIECKTFWDWANPSLICRAMNANVFAVPTNVALGVTLRRENSLPNPARADVAAILNGDALTDERANALHLPPHLVRKFGFVSPRLDRIAAHASAPSQRRLSYSQEIKDADDEAASQDIGERFHLDGHLGFAEPRGALRSFKFADLAFALVAPTGMPDLLPQFLSGYDLAPGAVRNGYCALHAPNLDNGSWLRRGKIRRGNGWRRRQFCPCYGFAMPKVAVAPEVNGHAAFVFLRGAPIPPADDARTVHIKTEDPRTITRRAISRFPLPCHGQSSVRSGRGRGAAVGHLFKLLRLDFDAGATDAECCVGNAGNAQRAG